MNRKLLAATMTLVFLLAAATSGFCEDDINVTSGKFGIGYGINASSNLYRHGIIGRYWLNDDWGGELFLGTYNREVENGSDSSQWDVSGKLMYSFITKKNSRFYGMTELGMQEYSRRGDTDTMTIVQPGLGFEYNFDELPEIGFDIEVGYLWNDYDDESGSDSTMGGTSATFGWHYYF